MVCKECKNCLVKTSLPHGGSSMDTVYFCTISNGYIVVGTEVLDCNKFASSVHKDITKKSVSELIDSLSTTIIKCFMAQEKIGSSVSVESAENAIKAQELNKRRCDLMRAIDKELGFAETTVTEKTYLQGENA